MFGIRSKPNPYRLLLFTVIFLLPVLETSDGIAHKVTVFAWVEGDTIYGQSKFGGGRKPKEATVIVTDTQGRELLKTHTDANGEFSFPIPQKTTLRIQLIAGMGHQGEWRIPAEELGAAVAESPPTPLATSQVPPAIGQQPPGNQTVMDIQALEAMIERALDQKLQPIAKMLAETRAQNVTLQDIIGGIGYILGLMGIALYFKSRPTDQ
jgi:nickel transport protein